MDANPLAEGLERERVAPPCVLVVFGASGDLTTRKLMPAIEQLALKRLLPASFAVVGVARTEMDDEDFHQRMRDAVKGAERPSGPGGGAPASRPAMGSGGAAPSDDAVKGAEGAEGDEAAHVWDQFTGRFRYVAGEYADAATFDRLKEVLDELDAQRGTAGNRVYYLATPPTTFATIAGALGEHGLNHPPKTKPDAFVRVVIEKPFGRDLESARELDRCLHATFDESQIYRIDHYLGKETVQNILALRFANAIFEPVWNRRYIDHVQITVAEALGVGHRGGFYEQAGALRDIVQNHVMQVLAITLMEPPATMDAQGIRDEKVKALRAVDVLSPDEVANEVVRAQYQQGWVEGEEVKAYREEIDVSPSSTTETYVAMRMQVDNWRWAGVPFYVRTGKRLPKRVTEVALTFKGVPHLPFRTRETRHLGPNQLVLRIQPDEGITLRMGAKVPGATFEVRSVSMDFLYGAAFAQETADAYERLLLDALLGDATLFIRTDEVEQAWRIVEPILEAWGEGDPPLARYDAGTWGPREADRLLERDGRRWRNP